jgi:dienelactone hydrolase
MKWIAHGSTGHNPHTPEHIDCIVETALKELKGTLAFGKIGALGYCLGAKVRSAAAPGHGSRQYWPPHQFVARHYKNGINVGYFAHPSYVDEEELAAITGPLSISAAELDHIFPAEKRYMSEEILKKNSLPYQINLFSDVEHGFAVRTDVSKKVAKFAKEQTFLQAVAWFDEHLL